MLHIVFCFEYQMTDRIKSCESERVEKQATVEMKAKTIDILPDAETKLTELQVRYSAVIYVYSIF